MNWYGFETTDEVVHGLYNQDYHTVLSTIHHLGYNTVRVPFSNQMIESPIVPSGVSFSNASGPINTDLRGLNSLQILDKVVSAAGSLGLRVILDNHRSEAGNSAEANGLWYTGAYPEASWISDWRMLANRYASFKDSQGNPTVIGMDLRNEPHNANSGGGCWTADASAGGCPASSAQNWPSAAQRAGNAILSVNPNLLIFVEGTDEFNGDYGFWGGNLEGARSNPVVLNTPNRVVYSAHDYGPVEYQQQWFNGSTSSSSLNAVWTKFWAYLSINNTAPVWVGEFGTTNSSADVESNAPGSQGQWFSTLVSFLGSHPDLQWTYWALNGEDRYGLLGSDYSSTPPSSLKQQQLSSIQFPLNGGGSGAPACSTAPAAPATLNATASSTSQISVSWSPVSAPVGCSVSYSVFRSMTNGFVPSASNQIASGTAATTLQDANLTASTTYYYRVEAADSVGPSAPSQVTSATTKSGASSSSCHISYNITNQWNTGFQVGLTIQNSSPTAINGWKLQWSFAGSQQITNAWNTNLSQSGQAVTLASVSYNGSIPAGNSYTGAGFTANYTGTNLPVMNFTLNGVPCS